MGDNAIGQATPAGRPRKPSRSGFTLIQLSALLMVASLVLVSILPTSQGKLQTDAATVRRLADAGLALRQFQAANGRLPCPADASRPTGDSGYGVEAANGGATLDCSAGSPAANHVDASNDVATGMLPWKTLALPMEAALDGYGRAITYAVDTNATECGWSADPLPGAITVTDYGTANTSVLALVGHGSDGHGAWITRADASGTAVRLNNNSGDADQLANAHLDASFVAVTPLTGFVKKAPTSTFDDAVFHKHASFDFKSLPQSAPRITGITPPADGTYTTGQALTFTVTYNTAVTVTGTPRLELTALNGLPEIVGGGIGYATYASGSGTTTLTFSYTVQAGDGAEGLLLVGLVAANGGGIKAGSACAYGGFTAPDLSHVHLGLSLYIADYSNQRIRKVNAATGIITTVAGNGTAGYSGDGGAATSAMLNSPYDMAPDAAGNLYIADFSNRRIRKVDGATGIITTVAGNGTAGYSGDGGAATSAMLNSPYGVAPDAAGNLYIADFSNRRIRKIDGATGIITTVAGNGTAGYSGDGGAATSAMLNSPIDIAPDAAGNLYIADFSNRRIRKVDGATGIITTVAGNGTAGYSGDGGAATSAMLNNPYSVAPDAAGNLYIADTLNQRIRKVDGATGIITTVAGNGTAGYSGDGGAATSAMLNNPIDIATDAAGNLYISDTTNRRIRKVNAATGIITTVAGNGTAGYSGDGGAATSAMLNNPYGVALSR